MEYIVCYICKNYNLKLSAKKTKVIQVSKCPVLTKIIVNEQQYNSSHTLNSSDVTSIRNTRTTATQNFTNTKSYAR